MDKTTSQFLIFALIILALLFIIGGDHLSFRIFPILTTDAPIHLVQNPVQINEEEDNVSIVINNKYENNPDVKILGATNPLNLKTTIPSNSSYNLPTPAPLVPKGSASLNSGGSSPAFNMASQNSPTPTLSQIAPSSGGNSTQIGIAPTPVSQGEVFVFPTVTSSGISLSNNIVTSSPLQTALMVTTNSPDSLGSSAIDTPSSTDMSSSVDVSEETPSPTDVSSSADVSEETPSPTYATSSPTYSYTTTSSPTYAYTTTSSATLSSAYSSPTTLASTAVTTSTYSPGTTSQTTTYSAVTSSSKYTTYSSK